MKTKPHILPTSLKMRKITGAMLIGILLLPAIMFTTSCRKGADGLPGLAFVAFTWIDAEPEYIEIENDFIPAVFYWDWYYRVDPGLYYLYYEGKHWRGGRGIPYAWELEYEVWENPGKPGKSYWVDGEDGPDSYFTIECSPYGPEVYHDDSYPEKAASEAGKYEVIVNNSEEIIVERHDNNYSIRIRYKKVEPRHHIN